MTINSMRRSSWPHGAAGCTLLLGVLAAQPGHAGDVADLIVFGDSSADLGSEGLDRRPTNNGPMWSERLAEALGKSSTFARSFTVNKDATGIDIARTGGNSYAVNGSTALKFDCCVNFEQQVDFFVQDRTRFTGKEVVFTWFTRNDITTAFADGLPVDGKPYSASRYAEAYSAQIDRLHKLGARNIVAFGAETALLPTQLALDNGTTADELMLLRQETVLAEAALWPKLRASGAYLIDIDTLGKDIIKNPGKYGFAATTDSYQQRGNPAPPPSQMLPDDGNVFTLDGHYTSAMQAVVADFTLAQLSARDRYAALVVEPLAALGGLDAGLAHRLTGADIGSLPVGGWSVSVASDQSRHKTRTSGTDPGVDQTSSAGQIGLVWRMTDRLAFGLLTQMRDIETDIGRVGASTEGAAAGGRYEGDDVSITAYGLARVTSDLTLSLAVTGGRVDHDRIDRRAPLGAKAVEMARGQTSAQYGSIRAGAAYTIDAGGGWNLIPAITARWSRVNTDGYTEATGPLSLSYGDATVNEGRVGGGLTLVRSYQDHLFQPYLSIATDHVFQGRSTTVQVGPTADMRVPFRTGKSDATRVRLTAGVDMAVFSALRIGIDGGIERSVFGGKNKKLSPRGRFTVSYQF